MCCRGARYGRSEWVLAILRCRDALLPLVQVEVGDGKDCHVWVDPQLSRGPILDQYGERVFYDVASVNEARLSDFISTTGVWPAPCYFGIDRNFMVG